MVPFKTFFRYSLIKEGGNVFGNTTRITREEIVATIKHLETITGLPVAENLLGSTGKAADSGDIDIAVDANKENKATLEAKLKKWGIDRRIKDIVTKKTGISVHFMSPIWDTAGNETEKFVQVDFMFTPDPDFLKFFYTNNESAPLKGKDRNILLSAIAKNAGYTLSANGLLQRDTKQLITKDPTEIAKRLYGKTGSVEDLNNVASLVKKLISLYGEEKAKQIVSDAEVTTGHTFINI